MVSQTDRYDRVDWDLNYRENPEQYVVGRGEFGVLKYEPYKSEILPHWKYKDKEAAEKGSEAIYTLFKEYLAAGDFPGADMARKFLQMGFTRAMRYAKYPGGKKYNNDGTEKDQITPDHPDYDRWADPDKREAAIVYKEYWDRAREHPQYQRMKQSHMSDSATRQAGLAEI